MMSLKFSIRLPAIILLGFAGSAHAQMDGLQFANELREKYGPALSRQTFPVRPGVEMVVDYAGNGHVCKIQLPPLGQSREPGVWSTGAIDDLVAELVPRVVRGKELRRWSTSMGLISQSTIESENVTITETSQGDTRTGITITFAREVCR